MSAPFSTRMGLVLAGAAAVLMLAIMVLMGGATSDTATVSGHGAANGLDGYAGLARLLRAGGYDVRMARGQSDTPGLLILTPPASADGAKINAIVTRHARIGPVLIISPKWQSMLVPSTKPGAKTGWVEIGGTQLAAWKGFLDDIAINTYDASNPAIQGPGGGATTTKLPYPLTTEEGRINPTSNATLQPLVSQGPHILAARYAAAGDQQPYPLTLVFEPDLLNNAGLARAQNADLAEAIIASAAQTSGHAGAPIVFDLTLNGLGHPANLMGLAFTPPYLAATLCLIMAALAAFWHGLARFGRPIAEHRAIALGKGALVANGARLIVRARRLHLLTNAYTDATRTRLIRALGLARGQPTDITDAAIDRALAHRTAADTASFTSAAAAMAQATTGPDIVRLAQNLHALERTLTP